MKALKRALKALLSALFVFTLHGCASSIHQVNVSDYAYLPGAGAKPIEVKHEKKYVIAKFDNNFVDEAYTKLSKTCKNGQISGLATTYYTDLSFFSFTEKIQFTGYCLKKK